MNQTTILWPVFALVALTFAVGGRLIWLRVMAVKKRTVSISYFRVNEGEMPEHIQRTSQNYTNLLELPLLFYTVVALLLLTEQVNGIQVVLAWVFVGLRVVHSVIQISYNNVVHRSSVWITSVLMLLLMWLIFGATTVF